MLWVASRINQEKMKHGGEERGVKWANKKEASLYGYNKRILERLQKKEERLKKQKTI